MSELKIKTGRDADARVVTFNYDIPTTLNDLVGKYGESEVTELASRAITLAVQALARQKAAAGSSDEDIQAAVNAWQPGVRGPVTRKSPLERASAALANMSKEELAELMSKVKAASRHAD